MRQCICKNKYLFFNTQERVVFFDIRIAIHADIALIFHTGANVKKTRASLTPFRRPFIFSTAQNPSGALAGFARGSFPIRGAASGKTSRRVKSLALIVHDLTRRLEIAWARMPLALHVKKERSALSARTSGFHRERPGPPAGPCPFSRTHGRKGRGPKVAVYGITLYLLNSLANPPSDVSR